MLNASAWNCTVTRSLILVFLKTAMLDVLMGWPRSVLRRSGENGVPKIDSASGSLMMKWAPLMAVTGHWLAVPPLKTQPALTLTGVPAGKAAVPVAAAGHFARVPSQN